MDRFTRYVKVIKFCVHDKNKRSPNTFGHQQQHKQNNNNNTFAQVAHLQLEATVHGLQD